MNSPYQPYPFTLDTEACAEWARYETANTKAATEYRQHPIAFTRPLTSLRGEPRKDQP